MISEKSAAIRRYTRHDRPFEYIAAQLGGPFDPFPSWFQTLRKVGSLRITSEGDVEVKVITGVWWRVKQGDYVVLQRGGNVWHVEAEDFERLWVEA